MATPFRGDAAGIGFEDRAEVAEVAISVWFVRLQVAPDVAAGDDGAIEVHVKEGKRRVAGQSSHGPAGVALHQAAPIGAVLPVVDGPDIDVDSLVRDLGEDVLHRL